MLLVIDNYDSFTYNLVQYLGELGEEIVVRRNDEVGVEEVENEITEKLYVPRVTPQRYLLLVETGDEVLDYRRAVERYAGAEQIMIRGGDHSLQSFPQHLPRILKFAGYS